ncbi:MAG: hypothetical protein KDE56_10995 [Anaerolineales bacterium]|nr:hypothetical protein [Anaerolineales bacterium]
MKQRVWTMARYLLRSLALSWTGIIYLLLTLVYWLIFFPPQQGTPDSDNYIVIIGVFGPAMTFLVALSLTTLANQAFNYPLVVRLASRVEYLTAVLLATLIFSTALQLLLAVLALISGPDLTLAHIAEIPPIWIAPNVLAAVLAMHASDFVTAGWSRVYIFGILAIFLLGQSSGNSVSGWFANALENIGELFWQQNWVFLGNQFTKLADWLTGNGASTLGGLFGFVFWPFRAIVEAVSRGFFTPSEALAPAIILLYATILFLLAADFFATKDLSLIE